MLPSEDDTASRTGFADRLAECCVTCNDEQLSLGSRQGVVAVATTNMCREGPIRDKTEAEWLCALILTGLWVLDCHGAHPSTCGSVLMAADVPSRALGTRAWQIVEHRDPGCLHLQDIPGLNKHRVVMRSW